MIDVILAIAVLGAVLAFLAYKLYKHKKKKELRRKEIRAKYRYAMRALAGAGALPALGIYYTPPSNHIGSQVGTEH